MTGLRGLREKKNMTVGDLAAKMGVHPQSVYAWESGRAKPMAAKIPQLIKLLGKDVIKNL